MYSISKLITLIQKYSDTKPMQGTTCFVGICLIFFFGLKYSLSVPEIIRKKKYSWRFQVCVISHFVWHSSLINCTYFSFKLHLAQNREALDSDCCYYSVCSLNKLLTWCIAVSVLLSVHSIVMFWISKCFWLQVAYTYLLTYSQWGSTLPPDCFVSRGSITPMGISQPHFFTGRSC